MTNETRVSAAELVRNFSLWQERAITGPVYITHHRRDRLVLLSIDQYNAICAGADAAASRTEALGAPERQPASELATELAAVYENISDAFILLDSEETILKVNARLEALWMINRDQLVGRKVQDFLIRGRSSLLVQKIRRVMSTRQPETLEHKRPNDPVLHLSTRIWPHGQGVILLSANITELTHLRQQSVETESLRDAIQRHPQVAHLQLDSRGRLTYSDDTIQVWTGFDTDTLANSRISDICAPDDRRRVQEAIEEVFSGHAPSALTARFLDRNFSEHTVHLSLAPTMWDQNATALSAIAVLMNSHPIPPHTHEA